MKLLEDLRFTDRGIQDLTGLQFATHLRVLSLPNNQVSDLSPIAGLIELRELWAYRNHLSDISPVRGLKNLVRLQFNRNQVSDLSPVRGLKNLVRLEFDHSQISDLSPVRSLTNLIYLRCNSTLISDLSPISGLVNLKQLYIGSTNVSDLSPISSLINLELLAFSHLTISDISPLAGLINLKTINTWGNPFSDLSPLAKLSQLEVFDVCGAELSDLSPLENLTELKELYLIRSGIPDISPLAGLAGLTRLSLEGNYVSDISALAGLTNLKWLAVVDNQISDFSPLDGLLENLKLIWHRNPGFPKGGPKIQGPWLWVVLPDTRLESGTDLLSEATEGRVTEIRIATQGATEGKPVGNHEWTSHKLPPTGRNNIRDMLNSPDLLGVVYGAISLYSPLAQDTTMYVGAEQGLKVWLNGALIHEDFRWLWGDDYSNYFPVLASAGEKCLISRGWRPSRWSNLMPFSGLNPIPSIPRQTQVSATPFPRRLFTSAIPLLSTCERRTSPTWRGGSLISPSTPTD